MNTWHTTLWFKSWETTTPAQYALSILGLVLLAVVHEAIACYRSCYLSGAAPGGGLQEPLVGVENPRCAFGGAAFAACSSTWQSVRGTCRALAVEDVAFGNAEGGVREGEGHEGSAVRVVPLRRVVGGSVPRLRSDKVWSAVLYSLNICSGYMLMLAVMTFNTGCVREIGRSLQRIRAHRRGLACWKCATVEVDDIASACGAPRASGAFAGTFSRWSSAWAWATTSCLT